MKNGKRESNSLKNISYTLGEDDYYFSDSTSRPIIRNNYFYLASPSKIPEEYYDLSSILKCDNNG